MIAAIAIVAIGTTPALSLAQTKPAGQTKAPAKPAPKAEDAAPKAPPASKAALRVPARLNATAPETYKATFATTAGDFVVEVHRAWAPKGADRFYNLVKNGYYDDCRFFRVIPKFMVQFGINGDPSIQRNWVGATINDDPVTQSNKRGTITFATAGPNSRTTQVFINYVDNGTTGARLDSQGFAPFGEVVSGMDVVDKLNAKYGGTPSNQQQRIQTDGNKFLDADFPGLDRIKTATIAK